MRYAVGVALFNEAQLFPFATLLVNLSGSFLLAWFTTSLTKKIRIPSHFQTAIATGFLGSFTTFSAVSVETVQLIHHGSFGLAVLYIVVSLFGGLWMSQLGYLQSQKEFGS